MPNKFECFRRVETWIFDLDNTLYPAHAALLAQIEERMTGFIAELFEVDLEDAKCIREYYYRVYGTTLAGLMQVHNLHPKRYLDYVHDIDLTGLPAAPVLGEALERLPGRKFIFTNASRRHAERVAEKLGVLHHFEDLFDITASNYIPKPDAEAYNRFLSAHCVEAKLAAMFEDLPHNLENPHVLGMSTVLVRSARVSNGHDQLLQSDIAAPECLPPHIHHVTDDLTQFLQRICTIVAHPVDQAGQVPVDKAAKVIAQDIFAATASSQ